MANPWWADLGVRSNSFLNGLANTPFVLDPTKLSGDATYNRQLMYSGAVPAPAPSVIPNAPKAQPPGMSAAGGAMMPAMPQAFPSTAAPAQTAALAASPMMPQQFAATSAPAVTEAAAPTASADNPFANIQWADEKAKERGQPWLDQLVSRGAFKAENAYEGLLPAIQRQLVDLGAKPQAGWAAEGYAAPQVPKGVDGFFAMTGSRATPVIDDSGAYSNRNEYLNSYQFVPTPKQEANVPSDLRSAVMSLLSNWTGGQNA